MMSAHPATISVTGETANGFEVTIGVAADSIFDDGFESGDTSGWSPVTP